MEDSAKAAVAAGAARSPHGEAVDEAAARAAHDGEQAAAAPPRVIITRTIPNVILLFLIGFKIRELLVRQQRLRVEAKVMVQVAGGAGW
mmetsp:Transcript_18102/g.36479  ORF Transcript_18102/g.36479 Transcript_18102/m.36479 type:complete len:89 (+) Transcript_18102:890-1156(+)